MALNCTSRCGASSYVEEVANGNWLEIEARLQALESVAGMPAVYSNETRPLASSVPQGRMIFNTSDNAPNWSNGVNWVDANGNNTDEI